MPGDAYLLQVRLLRASGIDLGALRRAKAIEPDFSQQCYFIAYVSHIFRGRSMPISQFGDSFDFTADPGDWLFESRWGAEADAEVVLELWCDRGDAEPVLLLEWLGPQSPPAIAGDGWRAGEARHDSGLVLRCEARALPIIRSTEQVGEVARSVPQNRDLFNGLATQWNIAIDFVAIRGLYQPNLTDDGSYRGFNYVDGYTSHDDEGRIYLNTGLDGAWARDQQLIEMRVRLTATSGPLPEGTQVEWQVQFCNDWTDDAPSTHREARPILEPACYRDGAFTGAARAGVEGRPSHAQWEEVGPCTLTPTDASYRVRTLVQRASGTVGDSVVRMHCPDVGGDAFSVKVVLVEPTSGPKPRWVCALTGTMAMWKRVRVQYLRMAGAVPLPVAAVPDYFRRAYVQLDFEAEQVLRDGDDRATLADSKEHYTAELQSFVDRVFTHRVHPGWFCLVSARKPYPIEEGERAQAWAGPVRIMLSGSAVDLEPARGTGDRNNRLDEWTEQLMSRVGSVSLRWGGGDPPASQLNFTVTSVRVEEGRIRLTLQGQDITPEFPGADNVGSIRAAYAQKRLYYTGARKMPGSENFVAGGYGEVPEVVSAIVYAKSASYESGISPFVPIGDGDSAFCGRTILFTHHRTYWRLVEQVRVLKDGFDDNITGTIVHELTHAFGMPHKCGWWDWGTPRATSCTMNYDHHGILAADGLRLVSTAARKTGNRLCARHLKAVRRVHLEDNRGLGWDH